MSSSLMTLLSFRVTNFRSVSDSGWIDANEVTSLIGTNESGKTNLLMPLWKLNPAKEGEINLITDAPRKDFNNYRGMEEKPVFISARFSLSAQLKARIAEVARTSLDHINQVTISRDFDGNYHTTFEDALPVQQIKKSEIESIIVAAQKDIESIQPVEETDKSCKILTLSALKQAADKLKSEREGIGSLFISELQANLSDVDFSDEQASSGIATRYKEAINSLQTQIDKLGPPNPNDSEEIQDLIVKSLPVFVYYSTYGNLDSEIYLPYVIEDLKRKDLTGRTEARARTLRVLFDFVKLKPSEILELGRDHNEQNGRATDAQIKAFSEKKKERSVLLQSASTELTQKFRDWWKQGEYRFRFEADGNHFRIWVSDDRRPEEIELEGRSTGLQWFLSFYLIFLVESTAAHHGAILLLDEPGHTLHPIAQRDLAAFFENLAQSNQLIYTTHSPFLIDADHLDRVRAVYVDDHGATAVSTDLRASPVAAKTKSVYPVHAALGLSVSDTMLQGCQPIVVEGISDQLYLSAIKTHLSASGKIAPSRELLFIPTAGTKAIKTVASILGGAAEELPVVLCDGDSSGVELVKNLKAEMYLNAPDKLLLVTDCVKIAKAEIEDLFPKAFMSPIIDRYLRGPDEHPFTATEQAGALVPQIKSYAEAHGIELKPGWKVDIARQVKTRLAAALINAPSDWKHAEDTWQALFTKFAPPSESASEKPLKVATKR